MKRPQLAQPQPKTNKILLVITRTLKTSLIIIESTQYELSYK